MCVFTMFSIICISIDAMIIHVNFVVWTVLIQASSKLPQPFEYLMNDEADFLLTADVVHWPKEPGLKWRKASLWNARLATFLCRANVEGRERQAWNLWM